MHYLLSLLALCFLGCSAIDSAPAAEIQKLPIVRVGDPAPREGEYVVYYPAGYPFALTLQTEGSLFASEQELKTPIAFARDLYLYKYWASHDGISWKNSHELLDVTFEGGLDASSLHIHVLLNAKERE